MVMNGHCIICREWFEFETGDEAVSAVSCGHTFHFACLSQWLERSGTCPSCRTKVEQQDVISRLHFETVDGALEGDTGENAELKNELAALKLQAQLARNEVKQTIIEKELHRRQVLKQQKTNNQLKDQIQGEQMAVEMLQMYGGSSASRQSTDEQQECQHLRNKLATLENIDNILNGRETDVAETLSKMSENDAENDSDTETSSLIFDLSQQLSILAHQLEAVKQENQGLQQRYDILQDPTNAKLRNTQRLPELRQQESELQDRLLVSEDLLTIAEQRLDIAEKDNSKMVNKCRKYLKCSNSGKSSNSGARIEKCSNSGDRIEKCSNSFCDNQSSGSTKPVNLYPKTETFTSSFSSVINTGKHRSHAETNKENQQRKPNPNIGNLETYPSFGTHIFTPPLPVKRKPSAGSQASKVTASKRRVVAPPTTNAEQASSQASKVTASKRRVVAGTTITSQTCDAASVGIVPERPTSNRWKGNSVSKKRRIVGVGGVAHTVTGFSSSSKSGSNMGLDGIGPSKCKSGSSMSLDGIGPSKSGSNMCLDGIGPSKSGSSMGLDGIGPSKSGSNMGLDGVGPSKSGSNMGFDGIGPSKSGSNMGLDGVGPSKSGSNMGLDGIGPSKSGSNMGLDGIGPSKSGSNMGLDGIGPSKSGSNMGLDGVGPPTSSICQQLQSQLSGNIGQFRQKTISTRSSRKPSSRKNMLLKPNLEKFDYLDFD